MNYGKDLVNTCKCTENDNCTVQSGTDETGLTGNAGSLKYSGSGFTYTVKGDEPKDITSDNDYFFVDLNSNYDYILFSNANFVAFDKFGKFI